MITEATQIVSGGTKVRMQGSDSQARALSTHCSALEEQNKSWGREGITSTLDRQTNTGAQSVCREVQREEGVWCWELDFLDFTGSRG